MKNQPYVKQYHEVDGVMEVSNPITKENPYLNKGGNRRSRNIKTRHRGNNKGHAIVVTGRFKYFKTLQVLKDRTIEHSILN